MTSRQATSEYAKVAGPAVAAVNHAVRTGKLTKWPCADCGSTANVEGHHHRGYEGDARLDVIWLCRDHHLAAHNKSRRAAKQPWERQPLAYMDATRGVDRYRNQQEWNYSTSSTPRRLFLHLERIWTLLATDAERDYARALVERLAAEPKGGTE